MMTRRYAATTLAVSGALALVVGASLVSTASASVDSQVQTARDTLANCQLLVANSTGAQRTRARDCVTDQSRILQLLGANPTPTPTAVPPTTPPATPPPTTGWPGPDNTGVPAGTTLTPWTGSCDITTPGLVIDARVFTCDVTVRATGVRITRSRINGFLDNTDTAGTFTATDSEIAQPGVRELTSVGDHGFTLLRVEVSGGNRGVYCRLSCDVRDSWIHGQRITATWHASAVRMEQGLTLVHNTLVCDAPVQVNPEGSCSASLTGYGDFAPVRGNLIQATTFRPPGTRPTAPTGDRRRASRTPTARATSGSSTTSSNAGRRTTTGTAPCTDRSVTGIRPGPATSGPTTGSATVR
jgi:hypothetical protein